MRRPVVSERHWWAVRIDCVVVKRVGLDRRVKDSGREE